MPHNQNLLFPIMQSVRVQYGDQIIDLFDPKTMYSTAQHCMESGDTKTAFRLFQLAAEQGHTEAQNELGMCYLTGEGNTKDLCEATRLFEIAANKGTLLAKINLANCLLGGIGISVDKERAFTLFAEAAEQGHLVAQFGLAQCYFYGDGVAQRKSKAFHFFKLAAEQGYALAQSMISQMLHVCAQCKNVESDYGQYQKCGGCCAIHYCGTDCQRTHWKTEHKSTCSREHLNDK
jgi:TPR repeat protein